MTVCINPGVIHLFERKKSVSGLDLSQKYFADMRNISAFPVQTLVGIVNHNMPTKTLIRCAVFLS